MRLKQEKRIIISCAIKESLVTALNVINESMEKGGQFKVGKSLIIEKALEFAFNKNKELTNLIISSAMQRQALYQARERLRSYSFYERSKKCKK